MAALNGVIHAFFQSNHIGCKDVNSVRNSIEAKEHLTIFEYKGLPYVVTLTMVKNDNGILPDISMIIGRCIFDEIYDEIHEEVINRNKSSSQYFDPEYYRLILMFMNRETILIEYRHNHPDNNHVIFEFKSRATSDYHEDSREDAHRI